VKLESDGLSVIKHRAIRDAPGPEARELVRPFDELVDQRAVLVEAADRMLPAGRTPVRTTTPLARSASFVTRSAADCWNTTGQM
jgi:hypothetical protein